MAELQLDTISVLARSHELVCYARQGPVGRPAVEAACWGVDRSGDRVAFEYWAHAAAVVPVGLWPWFAFRRRHFRGRSRWGHNADPEAMRLVLDRLGTEGPLTATELGGAKQGGPWWDWSPVKHAAERLLDLGEVVCATRRGWKRVYDLPERALPAAVRAAEEPDDESCHRQLVALAGRCLGVATVPDLAEYFRMPRAAVVRVVRETGLVSVEVDGWADPAWVDPTALAALPVRGRHRTTLLSPFDSMIWDRPRTERLFGFTHRIEAYTPAPKRVHGYYVMPLLAGGRIIGRVDPKRQGRTLVARQVSLAEPVAEAGLAAMATALTEAAAWVGCDALAVERANPKWLGPAVTRLTE